MQYTKIILLLATIISISYAQIIRSNYQAANCATSPSNLYYLVRIISLIKQIHPILPPPPRARISLLFSRTRDLSLVVSLFRHTIIITYYLFFV